MLFTSDRKTRGAKLGWLICLFIFMGPAALTAFLDNPRRNDKQSPESPAA